MNKKEKTREEKMLEADDLLKHSKAHVLYVVDQSGCFRAAIDDSDLNEAERAGFDSYLAGDGDAIDIDEEEVFDDEE